MHVIRRLKKPLYVLKQAPRAWNSKITKFLHQICFRISKCDNSLFIWSNSSGRIFNIIYLNDLVIGGDHLTNINKVRMLLTGKFKMGGMNKLHCFLGIEVIRMPLYLESSVKVRHDGPQATSWACSLLIAT